jgi:hypothetical protein
VWRGTTPGKGIENEKNNGTPLTTGGIVEVSEEGETELRWIWNGETE